MTIFDAQEILLLWFSSNDTFDPSHDFNNILDKQSLTKEVDRGIYEVALNKLAEGNVVARVPLKGASHQWVLVKPLNMVVQNVEIEFPLAQAVASIINRFSAAQGGSDRVVSSGSIGTRAIITLLDIINSLSSALNEKAKA